MNYDTRPPAKLSDLILLAVGDARRIDRSKYRPRASDWHRVPAIDPDADHRCRVCISGCVIAGTLGAPIADISMHAPTRDDDRVLAIDDAEWRDALFSLDIARCGGWVAALNARGQAVDACTAETLSLIPDPEARMFDDWTELDSHLSSLEDRAARLRDLGF